jgi:hypothetical protein
VGHGSRTGACFRHALSALALSGFAAMASRPRAAASLSRTWTGTGQRDIPPCRTPSNITFRSVVLQVATMHGNFQKIARRTPPSSFLPADPPSSRVDRAAVAPEGNSPSTRPPSRGLLGCCHCGRWWRRLVMKDGGLGGTAGGSSSRGGEASVGAQWRRSRGDGLVTGCGGLNRGCMSTIAGDGSGWLVLGSALARSKRCGPDLGHVARGCRTYVVDLGVMAGCVATVAFWRIWILDIVNLLWCCLYC